MIDGAGTMVHREYLKGTHGQTHVGDRPRRMGPFTERTRGLGTTSLRYGTGGVKKTDMPARYREEQE